MLSVCSPVNIGHKRYSLFPRSGPTLTSILAMLSHWLGAPIGRCGPHNAAMVFRAQQLGLRPSVVGDLGGTFYWLQ